MNIGFTSGGKGSCSKLVHYLEKENKGKEIQEFWFGHKAAHVSATEVEDTIDNNVKRLGKNDSKYFMLTINPSEKELEHIGSDKEKLKDYTRQVMDEYARNFHREGLNSGEDLVYFAKVEDNRYEKNKAGFNTRKKREGQHLHVHIIVSRKDKENRYKLSPMNKAQNDYETSNAIGHGKGRGYDRNALRLASERAFDQAFGYERSFQESFVYQNTMKHGSEKEQSQLLDQLVKDPKSLSHVREQERTQQRERQQSQGIGL